MSEILRVNEYGRVPKGAKFLYAERVEEITRGNGRQYPDTTKSVLYFYYEVAVDE